MSPIIVGIDFSPASEAILRHAAHAAAPSRTKVLAVHVLDSSRIAHWTSSVAMPSIDKLSGQAKRKLDELVAHACPGANVSTEVRIGRPDAEISKLVEEQRAALLVIAANDLTKKRLGAVAAGCVRSAPCDVLILRDWQEGNFTKIVVCTDFSPMAQRALQRGVELAASNHATLEVVHVLYPPEHDLWGEALLDEPNSESARPYAEQARARAEAQLAQAVVPHAPTLGGLDYRTIILESTSPAQALTWHIQEGGADLAILGTRAHSKLGGMLLGTNAERLLHDVPASVLAVREGART